MKKLFVLLFLTGCFTTQEPAPVVYGRNSNINPSYSRPSYSPPKKTVKQEPLLVEENISTSDITPIKTREDIYIKNNSYKHPVKIEKGDTLYSISKRYGTTVEELIEYNNISDPTNISIGTKIYIPTNEELSFILPISNGKIIKKFGVLKNGMKNDGINISANERTPIKASENGEVIYVGDELKDYGNLLIIRHNEEIVTAYSHADRFTVKQGDVVKKGQVIGYVGKTGHIKEPQLHFAIRKKNKPVNPLSLL